MTFDELARELDTTYDMGYTTGREEALGEFGKRHSADLVALEELDCTIESLVEAAQISPAGYWAKAIREGMKLSDRLRVLEHRVSEMEEPAN